MEHIVVDPMREVLIEVKDKDMFGSEIIGHARVPLERFLRPVEINGKLNEHFELLRLGFDAGRVHIRSEFIPEVAMGGGGMGAGAGLAMAAAGLGRRRMF